jgi:TonB dependent receptor
VLDGIVVAANFQGTLPTGVTKTNNNSIFDGTGQNAVGPRLGFAWKVLPHSSRLVLRGGYGLYYSRITGQVQTQNTTSQPFGQLCQSIGPPNAAATFANPFPAPIPTEATYPRFVPYTPTTAFTVNAIDPSLRPGLIQQYSLNLQTEIAKNLLLEVGYVGTRGEDILRLVSINQAQLASASNTIRGVTTNTVANVTQCVPFQGWTAAGLQQVQSRGAMRYNGLETSLTKRFSQGLQLLVSYM